MRKYTRSFTLLFLSAIAIFTSCKKESNSGGDYPPADTSNIKLVLSNMFAGTKTMTPAQTLEVNAGRAEWQVVYGSNGTRFIFYPNSFKDKNGNVITSGQIDLKLIEMYQPGKVIANRSSAISVGRLLRSGGQVYVKATRGGEEVFATRYSIAFPAGNTSVAPPMALFYGNNINADSIVTWTQAPLNAGTISNITSLDTNNGGQYYQFDSCTNFHWINCDYVENLAGVQLTDIFMVSKDSANLFNKTNTQVFLVFPSINSVTYMQMYNAADKIWSLSPTYQVPVNMPFHAVSISLVNGLYYYSERKNMTTTYDFVDTLKPEQKPLSTVISSLGNL